MTLPGIGGLVGGLHTYPALIDVITSLGLTSGLKLCLDAGDAASYGSGQKWLDRSGGGYDFHLGADATASATDPTFNGNSGDQHQEYFSGDGGDYFTYDSPIESWMQAMHKAGSISILAVVYVADNSQFGMFSASNVFDGFPSAPGSNAGLSFIYHPNFGGTGFTNRFWTVFPVSGSTNWLANGSGVGVSPPGLVIVGMSQVHNSDGSGSILANTNGMAFSSTNGADPANAAATNNPSLVPKIFANANGGEIAANGQRLYGLAVWQGTALSAANLAALWTEMRGRYGL